MITDPWDALDVLDDHATENNFATRWRGYVRACSVLLLPTLPPEARDRAGAWIAAADAYERGALNLAGLTAARVEAWEFHDSQRGVVLEAALSAIRAIMHRMWPDEETRDWHMGAVNFLEFCTEAGLAAARWYALLRAHFPDLLPAESSVGSTTSPPVV